MVSPPYRRQSLRMPWLRRSAAAIATLLATASPSGAGSDTRLIEAARNGDTLAVRALIGQGADVNGSPGAGATALHWAAHRDDLEMARALIRAGARVNAASDYGVAPIWLASVNGSAAMIQELLDAGANPNAALPNGETVLMTASRTGIVKPVELLLARGATVNAKEGLRLQTALMWAVAQRHTDVVRALIAHDADVQARSRARRQFVNSAGNADPSGVMEVEQGGFTALLFAARQGDVELARLLLTAGANVNDTAADGTSALVVATHSGHSSFAAFLLERDADPNAADAGYAALHIAIRRGDLGTVKALLARGANPNAVMVKGTPARRFSQDIALGHSLIGATPFWLAARFAEVDIMRVLAANGSDPRATTNDTTPLMAAMLADEGRRLAAITLLVELGADVNAVDQSGETALHHAAGLGLDAVVQFLADHGAKLDLKNQRGQTALGIVLEPARATLLNLGTDRNSTADLLRKLGAKE